ncbi:MAG: UDP-glucose dehydrogenase family protein [Hyphomicrobiales bacterium]
MKIAVVGAGYVGLVTGACLADFGYEVALIDHDPERIATLNAGRVPIYEAGLAEMLRANRERGRLVFTDHLEPAVSKADIAMIAVSTPARRGDDAADLAFVHKAASEIAAALSGYTVIVTKSTVPVGTARDLKAEMRKLRPDANFDVASNPEFLREGSAIEDFRRPDRIIVGSDSPRASELMRRLYSPITAAGAPMLLTDFESAELIKYAANAYLATRLAFVNELADLCEQVGADISVVTGGIGHDRRIGHHYLHPGPGFGGSCFPKDTRALAAAARSANGRFSLIEAVVSANDRRKQGLAERVIAALGGSASERKIALLGVAFKAETDDVRDSAALSLIPALQAKGARITAYDPAIGEDGVNGLAGVNWCADAYSAARKADAVVILTEWKEFRDLDLLALADVMKQPVMVDLRNLYSPAEIARTPFAYHSLGRAPTSSEVVVEPAA